MRRGLLHSYAADIAACVAIASIAALVFATWRAGGIVHKRLAPDAGAEVAASEDQETDAADTARVEMAELDASADAGARQHHHRTYNVVLITVDTLRADLGFAGYPRPVSPNIDALAARGVDGIVTTCGLLSIYQKELAAHCRVPVAASSLLQVPMVERMLPPRKRVGIVTYSAATMNEPYLDAVGLARDIPLIGMAADSSFVRWIRDGDNSVPYATLRDEVVATAESLVRRHPQIGALVL